MKGIFLFLLITTGTVLAQVNNPSVIYVVPAPSGSCAQAPPIQVVNSTGTVYTCDNGTWAAQGGGGGNGFPIVIGSTSIASGSTTTSISGLTLVAPALGTPTALVLINATGLPAAQVLVRVSCERNGGYDPIAGRWVNQTSDHGLCRYGTGN